MFCYSREIDIICGMGGGMGPVFLEFSKVVGHFYEITRLFLEVNEVQRFWKTLVKQSYELSEIENTQR